MTIKLLAALVLVPMLLSVPMASKQETRSTKVGKTKATKAKVIPINKLRYKGLDPSVVKNLTTSKVKLKGKKAEVTTYARKFEGRPCADGKTRFTHRGYTFASRGGRPYGSRALIYYHGNYVVATRTDTGRLPKTTKKKLQFDLTRQIAHDLGLYQKDKNGKYDYHVTYIWLD